LATGTALLKKNESGDGKNTILGEEKSLSSDRKLGTDAGITSHNSWMTDVQIWSFNAKFVVKLFLVARLLHYNTKPYTYVQQFATTERIIIGKR
jgi:hypothetical protein